MGKFVGTDLSAIAYTKDGDVVSTEDLFGLVTSYNHEIRAMGGYYQASMVFDNVGGDIGDDWFDNGLNRRIEIVGPEQQQIFEGFVEKVTVDEGAIVRSRGPVTGIVNKVKGTYVLIDPSTTIPLVGVPTDTGWYSDLTSQDLYGVVEEIIDMGEDTETNAIQGVNYHLSERAYPTKSITLKNTGLKLPKVSLSLKGFWHWMFYKYNDVAGTGTETATDKITSVVAADPNNYLSDNVNYIEDNSTTVVHYEDSEREAKSIIESLIFTSNGSYDRYTFGIYKDRIPYYTIIPDVSNPLYVYDSGAPFVLNKSQAEINPWDLRPAQWIVETGRLSRVGSHAPSLYGRPRPETHFIESVKYTAPYGFELKGGKVLDIQQGISQAFSLRGAAS